MPESTAFDPERFGVPEEPVGEFQLDDHSCTLALGRAIASEAGAGDFVGLIGPLGSGKTTLVSGMVEALDAGRPATSPTYTLVNRYETDPELVHVDLYRLESVDGLETTGYWDFVRAGDFLICVEWLDRIPEAWPGSGLVVRLEHRSEGRNAEIWASEAVRDRADAIVESFGGVS